MQEQQCTQNTARVRFVRTPQDQACVLDNHSLLVRASDDSLTARCESVDFLWPMYQLRNVKSKIGNMISPQNARWYHMRHVAAV